MNESFLKWVELHERAWGTETYKDRPSLEDIMNAPCVTFWRQLKPGKELRYTCKLYTRQADIEHYLTRLLMRSHIEVQHEKLARIFIGQTLYSIKRVRILLEPAQDEMLERLLK
jgi:hypothetical protein